MFSSMNKSGKSVKYESKPGDSYRMQEAITPYRIESGDAGAAGDVLSEPMVRTQIYLNRTEHEFVMAEAGRRNVPMAAVIRRFIDEKMAIPEDAWADNPMLRNSDAEAAGPEDGSINHDHYVYGAPKRFEKKDGAWVEAGALPADYFDKPAGAGEGLRR